MTRSPLLLCPGLLNDAALWRHQLDCLADLADARVTDMTGADSLAALAARALAEAPPRFALAGLSMGGYLAFEIVRQAPGRVTRLALFDTTARPDAPEATQRRRDLIDIARRGGFSRIPPQLLAALLHPKHVDDPAIRGAALAMAERIGAEAFIAQQTAIMKRPDSRPGLAVIAVPTLVVCGRQDSLTPPAVMAEIADGIPGAHFVVVEDSGHLTPLEQPVATSALMRYWLQV
ncbi:MAG TPA: alpha/beta fold hydrolase [Rhodospirillaceae bacterium]|nr:alpha/beta fold hydrolase [Rhodospirillaceae bacterium]